jgi:hypothetical protein
VSLNSCCGLTDIQENFCALWLEAPLCPQGEFLQLSSLSPKSSPCDCSYQGELLVILACTYPVSESKSQGRNVGLVSLLTRVPSLQEWAVDWFCFSCKIVENLKSWTLIRRVCSQQQMFHSYAQLLLPPRESKHCRNFFSSEQRGHSQCVYRWWVETAFGGYACG